MRPPSLPSKTPKAINIILSIYLLGGLITICDSIPVTTVATNSGVTFEEKLDAVGLIIDFYLVSFGKSTKAKLNCTALRHLSLHRRCRTKETK